MIAPQSAAAAAMIHELDLHRYLQTIDDETETAAFLRGMDKQLNLIRSYVEEGIPDKFPKVAWFRRSPDGVFSTVLKHGKTNLFNGAIYSVKGNLSDLEASFLLIRTHAATYAWEDWLSSVNGKTADGLPPEPILGQADVPPGIAPAPKDPPQIPVQWRVRRDRQIYDDYDGPPEPDYGEPYVSDGYDDHYDSGYPSDHYIYLIDERNIRPLLAGWPGNKVRLISTIVNHLPEFRRFVEPFAGCASLSLALAPYAYHEDNKATYLCADDNADIINLFNHASANFQEFGDRAWDLFDESEARYKRILDLNIDAILLRSGYVTPKEYLEAETHAAKSVFNFNLVMHNERCAPGTVMRAASAWWLQRNSETRHIRTDDSGNVRSKPGRIDTFPERAFDQFLDACQQIKFVQSDYKTILNEVIEGDVIYCRPPYADSKGDEEKKEGITTRHTATFPKSEQEALAALANKCATEKGVPVLISNSDNDFIRDLYKACGVTQIVGDIDRHRAAGRELLAIWMPMHLMSEHQLVEMLENRPLTDIDTLRGLPEGVDTGMALEDFGVDLT